MKHFYQFQQQLVLFIGLGLLLSLLASFVMKCNALEDFTDTSDVRDFISNYENRNGLSRKLLLSPGNS